MSEEDEVVTAADIEAFMSEEEKRFAGLNDSICTYSEGYIRQEVFSCLTCYNETNELAGVCFACSQECHDGHELVELYTRRQFTCDCGNKKFKQECKLETDKNPVNKYNKYGDTFLNKWCFCKTSYPAEKDTPEADAEMIMCSVCENWFHNIHLELSEEENDFEELICRECVARLPFLLAYKSPDLKPGEAKEGTCLLEGHEELTKSPPKDLMFQKAKEFRENLCKCNKCKSMYDNLECVFLTDYEESAVKYNLDRDQAAENKPTVCEELVQKVRNVYGTEVATHLSRELEVFKAVMTNELTKIGKDGIVTADTVKRIVSTANEIRAKRPRLDDYPDAEI